MISMELQRDVPQYMAIPWLMTWVMARTVSVGREGESAGWGGGDRGHGAQPEDILQIQVGRQEEGVSCKGVLQAVYFLAPKSGVAGAFRGHRKKSEPQSKKLVLKTISPNSYKSL